MGVPTMWLNACEYSLQITGVVSSIKVSLKVSISSCQGAEPDVGPNNLLHSFVSSSGLMVSSLTSWGQEIGLGRNQTQGARYSSPKLADQMPYCSWRIVASCGVLDFAGCWCEAILLVWVLTAARRRSQRVSRGLEPMGEAGGRSQGVEPEGEAEGRSQRAEPKGVAEGRSQRAEPEGQSWRPREIIHTGAGVGHICPELGLLFNSDQQCLGPWGECCRAWWTCTHSLGVL